MQCTLNPLTDYFNKYSKWDLFKCNNSFSTLFLTETDWKVNYYALTEHVFHSSRYLELTGTKIPLLLLFQAISSDGSKASVAPKYCRKDQSPESVPVSNSNIPLGATLTIPPSNSMF